MNVLTRLATAGFIFSIPVFLVTANVRFAAGDAWFYEQGFRRYDADQATGVSFPDLDRAAEDLIRYFEDDRSSLRTQVTIDGQETALFSEEETSHMRDVKGLMRAVFRLNEVSLAIILAYIGGAVLWTRERTPRQLAAYSLAGVGAGLTAIGAIGAFAVTGFDSAWTRFHEIAFSNDLWLLDPDTDHLIQMFPEPFWQDMTYLVGGLTVVEALAVVSLSVSYLVFGRARDGAPETARARSGAGG